jgi:hypothetical protein
LVSDATDVDGAYTIIWNQPPTAPDGITVTPAQLLSGGNVNISWGTSTDPDGSVQGYVLERAANGGAFAQIYRGGLRASTDVIQAGWTNAQYRVRAYDNNNLEGANTATDVLPVIASNPPVISGSDTDLGLQTGAFSQTYSVTNPDEATLSKTLTVVEAISGVVKRTYTATSGAENTFDVTADDFVKILNGSNTLTITATDNFGGTATRTFTFSISVSQIEFMLATPLAADDVVTRGIINITRTIPEDADFTVEVCNNGNDDSPAWEDVTTFILSNTKFNLANATKTADNWGFNVRIAVNRNGAAGDCYIRAVGGNFE